MGVDYFNCAVCDNILCDGGNYESFSIEEVGDLDVCEDCGKKLRGKLVLAEPWVSRFLAVTPDGQKHICQSLKQAQQLAGQQQQQQPQQQQPQQQQQQQIAATIMFGLYQSANGLCDERASAWLGYNVGSSKLLITTIDKLTEAQLVKPDRDPWSTSARNKVGWYNHHVAKTLGSFSYDNSPYFDVSDHNVTLQFLQTYASIHKLETTPLLVYDHSYTMRIFCQPDPLPIIWFGSLEQAETGRYSGQYVASNGSLHWLPTQAYLDEITVELEAEIKKKQERLAKLKSINAAQLLEDWKCDNRGYGSDEDDEGCEEEGEEGEEGNEDDVSRD